MILSSLKEKVGEMSLSMNDKCDNRGFAMGAGPIAFSTAISLVKGDTPWMKKYM